MTITQITAYLQKLESLVSMQQIELDKTRNLLGRALDASGGEIAVTRKEYIVPDNVSFDISSHASVICAQILPTPMKSKYEQIVKMGTELNL